MSRMAGTRLVLTIALMTFVVPTVLAQQTPAKAAKVEYTPASWPTAPSETTLLTRLALVTLLTLSVAGVVLYFIRRATRVPGIAPDKNVSMTVVGTASLGSGCTLHLLQVEQGYVVVGADRTGLKAIQPIEQFEDFLAAE